MGGGGASRARAAIRAPRAKPSGAPSIGRESRMRLGRSSLSGRIVRRRSPRAAFVSTFSIVPLNLATTGRSSTGAATIVERSQMTPQPNASAAPAPIRARPIRHSGKISPAPNMPAAAISKPVHAIGPGKFSHPATPAPTATTNQSGS